MWYMWMIPMAFIIFLLALNEHLSGRLKDVGSGILILIAIGLIVAAFFVSGWKAGVACIITALVSAIVLIPIARSIARHSSGYSDPRIAAYARQEKIELLKAFSTGDPSQTLETRALEDRRRMEEAVENALAQPSIQQVLVDHDCDRSDLEAFYERTEIQILPPELREVALKNPDLLDFFLKNSDASNAEGVYRRSVKFGPHLTLSLWTMRNPAAPNPPRS